MHQAGVLSRGHAYNRAAKSSQKSIHIRIDNSDIVMCLRLNSSASSCFSQKNNRHRCCQRKKNITGCIFDIIRALHSRTPTTLYLFTLRTAASFNKVQTVARSMHTVHTTSSSCALNSDPPTNTSITVRSAKFGSKKKKKHAIRSRCYVPLEMQQNCICGACQRRRSSR